jgi:hypothetical protein
VDSLLSLSRAPFERSEAGLDTLGAGKSFALYFFRSYQIPEVSRHGFEFTAHPLFLDFDPFATDEGREFEQVDIAREVVGHVRGDAAREVEEISAVEGGKRREGVIATFGRRDGEFARSSSSSIVLDIDSRPLLRRWRRSLVVVVVSHRLILDPTPRRTQKHHFDLLLFWNLTFLHSREVRIGPGDPIGEDKSDPVRDAIEGGVVGCAGESDGGRVERDHCGERERSLSVLADVREICVLRLGCG